jgi:hypothetical protein
MTVQEQIKQRINRARPRTVFFVNYFAEFDNEFVCFFCLNISICNRAIVSIYRQKHYFILIQSNIYENI